MKEFMSSAEKKVIVFFTLLKLSIHLFINYFMAYGIFRDEFYYLACTKRLAAGYVDHPPFSIFLLKINSLFFGDSLFALRLIPAITGALGVLLTGIIVKKLGGSTKSMVAAIIGVMSSIVLSGMFNFYSMNSLDIVFWSLGVILFIKVVNEDGGPANWIILGIVIGFGMLNKIGMGFLAAGFGIGILLTEKRDLLKSRWPWIAAVLATLIFSPFIIWNLANGMPHLEFIEKASTLKYGGLSRLTFITGQFFYMGIFGVLLALLGIFMILRRQKFRPLGIAILTVLGILIANGHSKSEYLSPAYITLFAAGAVQFISLMRKGLLKHLATGFIILTALTGLILSPYALPVLPLEFYIEYSEKMGTTPSSDEGKEMGELPQHFADRIGWKNMAETVSVVYMSLPENEREKCVVFAGNYGEAGALEYYSGDYPLPLVVSSHNSYWFWGKDVLKKGYQIYIVIGGDPDKLRNYFETVEKRGLVNSMFAMPYETNLPIHLCKGIIVDPKASWDSIKHYH